ncbi:Leucine-rich repeat neuronal protein 2-like protein [Dinothrombium tinctorium]|uniref:Leucine-rich repeat neuronal protein 2-like protein n=1 Tax=Dinothrombium tinctorium TaxID=1965070 RepID=A0A3S3QXK5_9ACAR|nr:Leucine-rich repeat neuronal protein 2-like protein [Dinothrombium tinctorium]
MVVNVRLMLIALVMMCRSFASALCPIRCTCHEKKLIVNCKKASLDVVPITLNPELRELHLSHNQIRSVKASFSFYQSLEFLDLSNNNLADVGRKNFAVQHNMRILFLNQNKISELSNQSFYGLTSLRLLNLNENALTALPSHAFAGLPQLEKLDLSRNQVSLIDAEAFAGLIKLKTLLLRNNKLTSVPSLAFYHLPNLVKLDIGRNALREIGASSLSALTALEDLSLDKCEIVSLHSSSLLRVNHLRRLQIEDNNLSEIPSDSIQHLKNLEELIIGRNRIARIEAFAFRGAPKLKILDIRHDHQLSYIDKDAFLGIPLLLKLIIEHCPKLKLLHASTLHLQKKSLKYLSLRGNHIASLPYNLINWQQLQYIDIRGNPFTCNCSLLWLWELLRQRNLSKEHRDEIICAEPGNLRGHRFLSLSLSEMACYESKHTIITGSVIVATLCALCSIILSVWCKTRLFLFIRSKQKYENEFKEDLTYYEKGRFLDKQVMFPHSTMIYIQSPIKSSSVSQV